VTRNLDLTARR